MKSWNESFLLSDPRSISGEENILDALKLFLRRVSLETANEERQVLISNERIAERVKPIMPISLISAFLRILT